MNVTLTIKYSTDDEHINLDISNVIGSFLPYMVDNVEIKFVEED